MRGITFILFLLLLPVMGALGHDAYLSYKEQDFSKPMMFSDLGYLWSNYEPETFQWMQKNVDQGTWENYLNPLMEQTSFVIAAVPAVLFITIVLLVRILGSMSTGGGRLPRRSKRNKDKFSFGDDNDRPRKNLYKRK